MFYSNISIIFTEINTEIMNILKENQEKIINANKRLQRKQRALYRNLLSTMCGWSCEKTVYNKYSDNYIPTEAEEMASNEALQTVFL